MANFYLVCGISGGGKTILTKRIVNKNKNKNLILYDVDKYYEMLNGDECDRSNSFDVWIKLFQDIHTSLLADRDVILTTNALTISYRRQFIEWFPEFTHHLLWVASTKEQCFEGNRLRKRHIPEDALEKQWNSMEIPNADEQDWATITQITGLWKNNNYISNKLKGDINQYIYI